MDKDRHVTIVLVKYKEVALKKGSCSQESVNIALKICLKQKKVLRKFKK